MNTLRRIAKGLVIIGSLVLGVGTLFTLLRAMVRFADEYPKWGPRIEGALGVLLIAALVGYILEIWEMW